MSNYTSLRTRSGSVGRGERDSGSSNYRSSYGPRDLPKPVSRMSRASSYDPFATRSSLTSSMTTYNRPSYSSNYSPMSHSYHPDYTSKSLSKRFGSSEQLNSTSYKSMYSNPGFSSSSKYRSSDMPSSMNRERSTYRASSTFSPRTPLGSDKKSTRDFTPSSRDFSSISLSKYRPDASTSSYGFSSSSSYARPSNYYSSTSSSYSPTVRYDYRSKTPGVTKASGSENRLSRYDRDFRSLCPIEKTSIRENDKAVDEVESTFQKLYNRYVKDTDTDVKKPASRKFISLSEEEATSEDEMSVSSLSNSDNEIKSTSDLPTTIPVLTPRASPSDLTPIASPIMSKKNVSEDVKTLPKTEDIPKYEEKIMKKEIYKNETKKENIVEASKSSKEKFEESHGDVAMKPAVIPTRNLKPAASAMDKLLRKDSLTVKLTDAIDKKKVPSESPSLPESKKVDPISKLKSAAEISKSTDSLIKSTTLKSVPSAKTNSNLKVSTSKISKSLSPAPNTFSSSLGKASPATKATLSSSESSVTSSAKGSPSPVTNPSSTTSSVKPSTSPSPSPNVTSALASSSPSPSSTRVSGKDTEPIAKKLQGSTSKSKPPVSAVTKLPPNASKSASPAPVKQKPALTINVKAAEEPTTEVTIMVPKAMRSRSSSPQCQRESSPQYLTADGQTSNQKMRRSASPTQSSMSALTVERTDRAFSEDTLDKKSGKKRRDPTRTLDNLREKLEDEQKKMENGSESPSEDTDSTEEMKSTVRPPLLLVTQPSMPSTPMTTTGTILWNSDPNAAHAFSDADWSDGEDEAEYASDPEYTISQTFKIPDRLPLGDLYPLRSASSSRCSPFGSDYDSDTSTPFLAESRAGDSRGRVDQIFAVPPPTFTCSVSYDGQEGWDSDEGSIHSCRDFDDMYTGRVTSSGLAYLTPSEDGSFYDEDSIAVGCTLKLVDRAAMMEEDDYTDDSEYYDDEEYTDEEYWDEDEEYEEEEEYEYEDEEVEEEEEEEAELEAISVEDEAEMLSFRESPALVANSADVQEEEMEFEEADEDFEMETSYAMALSKEVTPDISGADKYREVTYTKDVTFVTEEEETGHLNVAQDESTKAKAKRITKDGRTEKADKNIIPLRVNPAEEIVTEASVFELPSDTLMELDLHEHEDSRGTMEFNVIPTYVKTQTERVKEESASRFSDRKPSTDFARKAVIQPNKLETVKVQKVETKLAETPKPALEEEKKAATTTKAASSVPSISKAATSTTQNVAAQKTSSVAAPALASTTAKVKTTKTDVKSETSSKAQEPEDKSNIRKSALNMTQEDAKKKAKTDEEAAKIKARRFGTVSALMDKFKEEPKQPEPITYKRSSRLTQKEPEERPRRKYEVIKPVINDEFDKQMEEIRAKMKAGQSQLQSEMKNLSKGITTASEEAKKRELEEKHKLLLDKASGVFSEADKEKMRWKERRDAETEVELARIEANKGSKAQKQVVPETKPVEEPKKEPKRTVRKIVRDKSPAVNKPPDFATTPKISVAAAPGKPVAAPSAAVSIPPPAPPPAPAAATTGKTAISVLSTKPPVSQAKEAVNKAAAATSENTSNTESPAPRDMFRREKTPVVKPADMMKKPSAPKQDIIVDESNFDLLQAATQVATRRRKSIVEMKMQKEKGSLAVSPSRVKNDGATSPKLGPKGDGAAATKIRNALGNVANTTVDSKSPAGSEKGSSRRYGARRRTQEIVNESQQPKRRRKEKPRKNRFIRDPHDIDILLGWDKENTFEKMEKMFQLASSQKKNTSEKAGNKIRRNQISSKTWISELMDIDKIYKPSEIRDITASVDM